MEIEFDRVIPILRIFNLVKADEFYVELSEHHGDGNPGARLHIMMRGVESLHRELSAKNNRCIRPGLEATPWLIAMTARPRVSISRQENQKRRG